MTSRVVNSRVISRGCTLALDNPFKILRQTQHAALNSTTLLDE